MKKLLKFQPIALMAITPAAWAHQEVFDGSMLASLMHQLTALDHLLLLAAAVVVVAGIVWWKRAKA